MTRPGDPQAQARTRNAAAPRRALSPPDRWRRRPMNAGGQTGRWIVSIRAGKKGETFPRGTGADYGSSGSGSGSSCTARFVPRAGARLVAHFRPPLGAQPWDDRTQPRSERLIGQTRGSRRFTLDDVTISYMEAPSPCRPPRFSFRHNEHLIADWICPLLSLSLSLLGAAAASFYGQSTRSLVSRSLSNADTRPRARALPK